MTFKPLLAVKAFLEVSIKSHSLLIVSVQYATYFCHLLIGLFCKFLNWSLSLCPVCLAINRLKDLINCVDIEVTLLKNLWTFKAQSNFC